MKSNADDSEIDTDELLLSGVDMISSATSLISDLEKKTESSGEQTSKVSVQSFPQKGVRRLNFDEIPTNNGALMKISEHSSAPFLTSSCPTTPLTNKSKSCLKKSQSPSPLKSLTQVSFVSENDGDFDDGSAIIPIEKCQKLRSLFNDVRQEFEKLSRISNFGINSSSSFVATENFSSSSTEEAKEEINFIKNLNAQELREIFETELYKRMHGEKKIRMLQKQNLDLEQRLTVSSAVNNRRNKCLVEVESLVDDLINDLMEKDKGRQLICSNLLEQNSKLKDSVGQLINYSETLTKKYEKLNEEFNDRSKKLIETEKLRSNLQSDNENLRQTLKTSEDCKESLLEKVRCLESDKKRAAGREEELTKELISNEKILKESAMNLQKLKNELNSEKTLHRSQIDEIERQNKMKLFDLSQEYEKRLIKLSDDCEQRKLFEIRKLKNEFDASLQLYDEKFVKTLNERDESLKKLKEFERCFEDNLRIMYNSMQQRLTTKYYELVSEFALPPQRPASVAAGGGSAEDKRNYNLADEFLDRLQKAEPLATPRHGPNNNNSQSSQMVGNNRNNPSNTETLQHFSKLFSKSHAAASSTPADPPGKL